EIGRGRVLREGNTVALLSLGCRLPECLAAADELQARGLSTTVADARFAKPIDEDLILRLARDHEVLVTIEEASGGGFAAQVMTYLARAGCFDAGLKFRPMTLPDRFVAHGTPDGMYLDAGLVAANITTTVLDALGLGIEAVHVHG
ncbi:MAG: 1-deoxy-D-xylulose-5-phosphate synthase, partial [Proteobacteria bacterium]|nr:1-deoxy-D-xylulose-5-phosphate synthase [Pseudomonadota bacterium]